LGHFITRSKVAEQAFFQRAFQRGSFSDPSLPFRMDFVQTGAHLSWSGRTGDDSFHTTAGKQTVNFAQIANERNGVFFDDNDEDNGDD
jgi:hypothetical protein